MRTPGRCCPRRFTSAASRLIARVCAIEPADTTTNGESADAGVAHDAAGRGQAVDLRLVVDVAPQGASLAPRRCGCRGRPTRPASLRGRQRSRRRIPRCRPRCGRRPAPRSLDHGRGHNTRRRPRRRSRCTGRSAGAPVDCAVPHGSRHVIASVWSAVINSPRNPDICMAITSSLRCRRARRTVSHRCSTPGSHHGGPWLCAQSDFAVGGRGATLAS